MPISILAPARGATMFAVRCTHRAAQFQSSLPRGERRLCDSKHLCQRDFNPRSREGSDAAIAAAINTNFYFNPRSREGSDLLIIPGNNVVLNFNPRSREGSDAVHCNLFVRPRRISILAPARGATLSPSHLFQWGYISILAPARGATDTSPRSRPYVP